MYNRPLRRIVGLAAVGGATAVGITTHDAGFTALTFVGALLLPRILGLGGHHRHGLGCAGRADQDPRGQGRRNHMREHFEQRLETWHHQAHGDAPSDPATTTTPATA